MQSVKNNNWLYYRRVICLGILGIPIGVAVALIEVIFGTGLSYSTAVRNSHPYLFISLLPLAGLLIVWAYKKWGKGSEHGMGMVFKTALGQRHYLPRRIIPFAIGTTWLTHVFGGSAGREGVAVQIGATLSYNLGRKFRFDDTAQILIVAGMSAGFAGLFQTPIAACCFALEVLKVGHLRYRALFPAFTASITAARLAATLGTSKEAFNLRMTMEIDYPEFWKLLLLGIIFGVCGMLFAIGLHKTKSLLENKIPNQYIRIFAVGAVISIAMLIFEHGRYSGSGANLIMLCIEGGNIFWYDFILKAVLTILTLSAGYQGGEVTPLFTIGSCLGVIIAPLFGMDPVIVAALGYAGVFAGGTNTLLAPIFIGGEIFGFSNIPYFAVVCTAAFLCNADHSIYSNQKISYTRWE